LQNQFGYKLKMMTTNGNKILIDKASLCSMSGDMLLARRRRSLRRAKRIQFTYGHNTRYSYDATGIKRKVVSQTVKNNMNIPLGQTNCTPDVSNVQATLTTDYCGNVVYENGALKYILTPEGYVTKNGRNIYYNYHLKDHLGNNRIVLEVFDNTCNVMQATDYYPFGMPYANGFNPERQPYKFGGKEYDEMHGLNWHDFEARAYDGILGRFPTIMDPLAEKYYSVSPYAYCLNNPVRFVDQTGQDVWEIDAEGRIIQRIEDKTQDAFYMVAKDADGNYQRTFTTDAEGNKNYNSISFKYRTVESQRSISFSPDGKSVDTYDVYQVRGDENGTVLFEFLGNNVTGSSSKVEMGQAKTGIEGENGLNFITTSHEAGSESGLPSFAYGRLNYGYTIREITHSHPISDYASQADISTKSNILSNLEIAKEYGLQNGQIPIFRIYHVPTKTYITY
jgi:RHS repeat-associated protein